MLCAAGAVTGSGTKTLVFDDEGTAGTSCPLSKPLSLYDGTSTLDKWTLKITDTVKNLRPARSPPSRSMWCRCSSDPRGRGPCDGLRRCYCNADHLRRGSQIRRRSVGSGPASKRRRLDRSVNPIPRSSQVHERWYVMKRTHWIAIAALALGVLAAAPKAQAQTKKITYAITDLGPCTSFPNSTASKINGNGQVIGTSFTDSRNRHACIWERRPGGQWVVRDLGVPENCTLRWPGRQRVRGSRWPCAGFRRRISGLFLWRRRTSETSAGGVRVIVCIWCQRQWGRRRTYNWPSG